MKLLTKSGYLSWRQCPKRLWLEKFRPDLLPTEIDVAREAIMATGGVVEKYAYKLFPDGVSASAEGFRDALDLTEKLIQDGQQIIFQPSFISGDLYCRCDIVRFGADRAVDIIEVKSSTEVKSEHLPDLAFQRHVLSQLGFRPRRIQVIHINRDYVRHGEIDPKKLLVTEDITADVVALSENISSSVPEALTLLRQTSEPAAQILRQCENPYECPFIEYCWQEVPSPSVYDYRLTDEALAKLVERGQLRAKDVPVEMLTRERDQRFLAANFANGPVVRVAELREWLKALEYPIAMLDYETSASAIPPYDGCRPYQQMPFQFSVHVIESAGAVVKHYEFLADEAGNPVADLLVALAAAMPKTGTVLAWHMPFEKSRNEEMAESHPKFAKFLASINQRMRDLKEPFSEGLYVDARFLNSASLKAVVPIMVPELSYDDLTIGNGGDATVAWPEMVHPDTTPERKAELRAALLKYCGRDTEVMVSILNQLQSI